MLRRLALILSGSVATSVSAQLPERFENLKFFPATITRDSLVSVMRNFSFSLGVRCVYCHVGEDSPNLAGIDWKSDEKATKRTAREMLRMVADINTRVQSVVSHAAPVTVKCATCHRGVPRPIALEDSLYKVAIASGGDAALVAYDTLRARFHGRSAYDFGSGTLIRVSERLYVDKKHADALPLLRRNTELFPRLVETFWNLGMHLEALNRTADAVAAYRAILERVPNHQGATTRLRVLAPPP